MTDDKPFTIENGIIQARSFEFREENKDNFGEILLDHMKQNPDFIAQVDSQTGQEDTFGSMIDRSVRCALWLLDQKIGFGDVVAICSHNHVDQASPALASLYIGAIFTPWWDYGMTPDMAKHFLTLTTPKVLFVNEECLKVAVEAIQELKMDTKVIVFGNNPSVQSFDSIIASQQAQDNFQCAQLPSIDHPALIIYTSGSTGLPKGALQSHKCLLANIKLIFRFDPQVKTSLWHSTLCWVSGVLNTFCSILTSVKRVIPASFTEENTCQVIEKYLVNRITMSTSMANRLLKSGAPTRYDTSSVLVINLGGSPVEDTTQKALAKAFPRALIRVLYGLTEVGGVCVLQREGYTKNSVGTLAVGYSFKVIDPETEKVLKANEKGELCVKSSFMMTQYYRNPDATKSAIDSEGWFHTGDLGYYDENGEIFIIDRLKELIKWRNHHVPPAMIEQLLQSLPGIAEVAVVSVPDWEDNERPLAFVVKTSESDVTEQMIHHLVDERLPDQMKLRAGIQFLTQIPHTASGKIARPKLKTMAAQFARD